MAPYWPWWLYKQGLLITVLCNPSRLLHGEAVIARCLSEKPRLYVPPCLSDKWI